MTPKAKVLRRYPHAHRTTLAWFLHHIRRDMTRRSGAPLGHGMTPREAWADAASRLTLR